MTAADLWETSPGRGDDSTGFDEAVAVLVGDRRLSYAELTDMVAVRRAELGAHRCLVLLAGSNDLDFVVSYLAARAARHPVLLVGADSSWSEIADRFQPGVVVTTSPAGYEIDVRKHSTPTDLHPDLALLLSTSGSTGHPKLVRLSAANLDANATAIAESQGLDPSDRGITSLPLHYCYGLSVLNAHLAVGASIVVTDRSVVDPCFWDDMRRFGVTNLAGVPHTFELIERSGIEQLRLDRLRLVTQAGGRFPPDRVRHLASIGRTWGWDLMVMYGQTEATARMGYLPPDLALDHPDRVGVAIPGGAFEIRACPDLAIDPDLPAGDRSATGVGEVVYRGPNVMMGYAESIADLGRPAELDHLATGDLGRIDEHGLLEIVGRRHRFAKLFGLRVDLARIERQLAERGIDALCASDDQRLVVGVEVERQAMPTSLADLVAGLTSLPARAIDVVACDRLPRRSNGKLDAAALLAMRPPTPAPPAGRNGNTVGSIFADVLRLDEIDRHDTFASLGGDSFSYVEVSIRIEDAIGYVPDGWHVRPLAELEALPVVGRRRRTARVETNVVLRAVAITTIVITHMRVARVPAGAHILLAVVGFNFARFQLPRLRLAKVSERVRDGLLPIAKIAAITAVWIAVQMTLVGGHGWPTLLLVNDYVGSAQHVDGRWRYWFFEAIVQISLVLFALFSIERVRRFDIARPFLTPLLLLVPAAVLRFELVRLVDRDYNYVYRPDTIAWCFLLGWAAAQAVGWKQRSIVVLLAIAIVPGYFHGNLDRELRVIAAVVLLACVPTVIVPRLLARPLGWVASASMWIFMTHWIVWPAFARHLPPVVAVVATVGAGVGLWGAWRWSAWRWRGALTGLGTSPSSASLDVR